MLSVMISEHRRTKKLARRLKLPHNREAIYLKFRFTLCIWENHWRESQICLNECRAVCFVSLAIFTSLLFIPYRDIIKKSVNKRSVRLTLEVNKYYTASFAHLTYKDLKVYINSWCQSLVQVTDSVVGLMFQSKLKHCLCAVHVLKQNVFAASHRWRWSICESGKNCPLLKYFMSASIIHLKDDITNLWVTLCWFKYMASEIGLAWLFPRFDTEEQ